MNFRRIDPPARLRHIIECYWIAESDDPTRVLQKIIPDGFPELIFHFGDPYRIRLKDKWQRQPMSLLAGQITSHFFLENTGKSSILGLKFKPAALATLFDIPMHPLTDRVVELKKHTDQLQTLEASISSAKTFERRLALVDEHLEKLAGVAHPHIDRAIQMTFEAKGIISVHELCEGVGISERQLERAFKKYIGVSPKFYARIIRFSNIFQAVKAEKQSWAQVGLETGYYDQSHFIKNFKAFTGEDPSAYFFDDPNLANFFLKK